MLKYLSDFLAEEVSLIALATGAVGIFIGGIVGVVLTIAAHRPRLIIGSHGSGSGRWLLGIRNLPSFLGRRFHGDPALRLHAWIQLQSKGSRPLPLFWHDCQEHNGVSLDPGESRNLVLFRSNPDHRGYLVVDRDGQPVARFDSKEAKFSLWINDHLDRKTTFRFTVLFDDTNLRDTPRLEIKHPITLQQRWIALRMAWAGITRALTMK